ncbi:hypothetical protein Fmac_025571 [Flemingia macrophylla]|uniref:Uncharacterized protein n=1 Tax=Flemingia macrophylla TaxID=520843 RepID=A0ABD1LSM4_9FABA
MPLQFFHCDETDTVPSVHPPHHEEQNLYLGHNPGSLFLKPNHQAHHISFEPGGVKYPPHGICALGCQLQSNYNLFLLLIFSVSCFFLWLPHHPTSFLMHTSLTIIYRLLNRGVPAEESFLQHAPQAWCYDEPCKNREMYATPRHQHQKASS